MRKTVIKKQKKHDLIPSPGAAFHAESDFRDPGPEKPTRGGKKPEKRKKLGKLLLGCLAGIIFTQRKWGSTTDFRKIYTHQMVYPPNVGHLPWPVDISSWILGARGFHGAHGAPRPMGPRGP